MRTLVNIHIWATILQFSLGQEATLFDDVNYGGDSVKVSYGGCVNVLNFNDRTSSLKNKGCIRLWENIDCTGRRIDVPPPGEANMVNKNFNDLLTSVSDCRYGAGYSDTVTIAVDTSEATDLQNYGEKAKKLMQDWFPFMQNLMLSPAYTQVTNIKVKFPKEDRGIFASGNYIEVPAQYLRNNPSDWGVFIHEMTHVIQQARGCPGWVVEGMAEYTRRWFFEPQTTKKPPRGTKMNDYLLGGLAACLSQHGSWQAGDLLFKQGLSRRLMV